MKQRVLFICDENSCLSQIAEGLLRKFSPDGILIESAGIRSSPIHPLTVKVMSENGIDISNHRSKTLQDLESTKVDLVITLSRPAEDFCIAHSVFGGGSRSPDSLSERLPFHKPPQQRIYRNVPDPTKVRGNEERIRDAFVAARDLIAVYLHDLVERGIINVADGELRTQESISNLLDDGVIAHSTTDRRIVLFNKAAEDITGYDRNDVIGRDCRDIFLPDGLCASLCKFGVDPSNRFSQKHETIPFITHDGTVRQLKIFIKTAQMDSDLESQIVIFIRDVTEACLLSERIEFGTEFEDLAGVSKTMRDVYTSIRKVSVFDYPVLIQGESGTGKELVARAIHNQSRRKAAPFISISCRSLPDHMLESELFGHVRDAFPGAIRHRKGGFQLADRGTVFLDEVAELSPVFQTKLLRVLQDSNFRQVGGEELIPANARIVSATTRDLRKLVEDGAFREDLFYRLCVMPIHLPALRSRQEDIPFLVDRILREIGKETGKAISGISHGAMGVLLQYSWPGNVRELNNTLRFAAIRCDNNQISMVHLPFQIVAAIDDRLKQEFEKQDSWAHQNHLESRKRKLNLAVVEQALSTTKGNKVRAAKLLKVSRATLYRFLDNQTD